MEKIGEISQFIIKELAPSLANITLNNITNNSTLQEDDSSGHASFLSAKTLIAIIILLLYTIANSVFEKLNFHYIHESGICMILGFLVGLVSMLINPFVTFIIN